MAFTVTARHSGNSGQSAQQTRATDSVAPTSNSLLLAFWGAERNSHSTAETFTISGGALTYTQVAASAAAAWNGLAVFSLAAVLYRAPVGSSALPFAITVDSWATTATGFYGVVACDVTGHDATTPIAQSKAAGAQLGGGDAHAGSVTFDSPLTVGSLIVVGFSAGADSGGGFAAPTLGGQPMTQLFNQATAFCQSGLWYRVITGAESNRTITCADLGQSVGNYGAVAVEVAAEPGGSADVLGAATLAAASSLAAGSRVDVGASSTLAGSGALAATARLDVLGVAALSSSSTLTAAPRVDVHGSASLAAQSTLTAAVSGAGDVTGAAALTATSALTASPRLDVQAAAALATESSLTAVVEEAGVVRGAALLAAQSSLATSGRVDVHAAAELAAVGDLQARGRLDVYAAAALAAGATLVAAVFDENVPDVLTLVAITDRLTLSTVRDPLTLSTVRDRLTLSTVRNPLTITTVED